MPTDASADPRPAGALEIRGSADGLLDDPILLRVRGAGAGAQLTWRARYRDDDARVWRASASRCEDLATSWAPAKDGTGAVAALRSLRAVSIDVRVETADGRAATRTLTRRFAADGVRTRRWRDGLAATLHVPAATAPCATVIIDATAGAAELEVATLAAPLLASRGVLVLVVAAGSRGGDDPAGALALAHERLAAVPGASEPIVLPGVVLAPGVGAREALPEGAVARAAAWDALLAHLGARPRDRALES